MRTHPSMAAGLVCLILSACGTSPGMTQAERDLRVSDVELASGATTAALQIAQGVVAAHPDDVAALVRLGNAQSALGENEAAESSFRRALEQDSGSSVAKFGLARLHLLSDPALALQELKDLLRHAPDDPKVLTDLGVADDMMSHHDDAQLAYRHALSISPALMSAQVDLGLSMALSGKVDQALTLLGPLAQSSDASPKVRQDYAVAAALAGRTDDARSILHQDLPAEQVALAIDAFRELQIASR